MSFKDTYYYHLKLSYFSSIRSIPWFALVITIEYFLNLVLLWTAASETHNYFKSTHIIALSPAYSQISLSSFMDTAYSTPLAIIISIIVIIFDLIYSVIPLLTLNYDFYKRSDKRLKRLMQCIPFFYDVLYFRIFNVFVLHILTKAIFENKSTINFCVVVSVISLFVHCLTSVWYFTNIKIDIWLIKTKDVIKVTEKDRDKKGWKIREFPFDLFSSRNDLFILLCKLLTKLYFNAGKATANANEYNLRIFFAFASLAFLLGKTSMFLVDFFVSNNNIITFTNRRLNNYRIMWMLISFFSVLLNLFFNDNNIYFLVFGYFASLALVFMWIWFISSYRDKKIIHGDNILIKIMSWIVCDIKTDQSLVSAWFVNHSCRCGYAVNDDHGESRIDSEGAIINTTQATGATGATGATTKCKLCEYIFTLGDTKKTNTFLNNETNLTRNLNQSDSIEYTVISLFMEYYEYTRTQHSQKWDNYYDKYYYHFIKTYLKFHSIKRNNFQLGYFCKSALPMLSCVSPWISHNWMLCYDILIRSPHTENHNLVSQCQEIAKNEQISTNIASLLAIYLEWLKHKESIPYVFIENSKKLFTWKKQTKLGLSTAKGDIKMDYTLVIMRYIYETLFDKPSKNIQWKFNIDLYLEHWTNCFESNNFIQMKFCFERKDFLVHRASAAFYLNVGCSFFKLFPFKEMVLEHVVGTWNSQKKILEMPINSRTSKVDGTVTSCKFAFTVFPSINMKDCLIYGNCYMNYCNIVITKYDKNERKEYLHSYSYSLFKDKFLLPPIILQDSYNKSSGIEFSTVCNQWKQGECQETKWVIDYQSFLIQAKKICEHRIAKYGYSAEMTQMISLIHTRAQGKQKENMFWINMHSIGEELSRGEYYNIYYFDKSNSFTDNKVNAKDKLYLNDTVNINNDLKSNYLINSASSMTRYQSITSLNNSLAMSVNNPELLHQLELERNWKRRQNRQFSLFSLFWFTFNFVLILYTLVILIVEINDNNQFKISFNLFQEFHKYLRVFMNGTISFFFSWCLAQEGETECSNKYHEYCDQLGLDKNFPLQDYITDELIAKMKYFTINLSSWKKWIDASGDQVLNDISESSVRFRYWITSGWTADTDSHQVEFFSAVNWYLGWMYSVMDNSATLESRIPMYIINVSGSSNEDFQLENIIFSADPLIKQKQIEVYGLIFNYRIWLSPFNTMAERIKNNLLGNVNTLKNLSLIFICLLLVFHVLLLAACFFFMFVFRTLLNQHCVEVGTKLKNKNWINAMLHKISIWQQLNNYYENEPCSLFTKIADLKSKYQAQLKIEMSTANKDNTSTSNSSNTSNARNDSKQLQKPVSYAMKSYDSTWRSSRVITLISYSITILFTVAFLVVFVLLLEQYYTWVFSYYNNSNLDFKVYSLFSLLQVNLVLTQTNEQLYDYYYPDNNLNPEDKEYTLIELRDTYNIITTIERSESIHQSLITPWRDTLTLSCDNTFDTVINTDWVWIETLAAAKYLNVDSLSQFKKICDDYNVWMFNNDKTFIKNIIYRISNICLDLVDYSYTSLYKISTSKEMFDTYILLWIIYRPLRHYEHTEVFVRYINSITDKYALLMYVYLIGNICIEMILWIIVRTKVICKYKDINKSMDWLGKSLKV